MRVGWRCENTQQKTLIRRIKVDAIEKHKADIESNETAFCIIGRINADRLTKCYHESPAIVAIALVAKLDKIREHQCAHEYHEYRIDPSKSD